MNLSRRSWLATAVLTACMLSGVWLSRDWVVGRFQNQLASQHLQRVADLPAREAAVYLRELASDDAPWLDVLVPAVADQRPEVSSTATSELRQLVAMWMESPEQRLDADAARLAQLLAEQSPRFSAEGQELATVLARNLIVLRVNSGSVDVARYINNCEAVLRLEPAADLRVASVDTDSRLPQNPAQTGTTEPLPFNATDLRRITER